MVLGVGGAVAAVTPSERTPSIGTNKCPAAILLKKSSVNCYVHAHSFPNWTMAVGTLVR